MSCPGLKHDLSNLVRLGSMLFEVWLSNSPYQTYSSHRGLADFIDGDMEPLRQQYSRDSFISHRITPVLFSDESPCLCD